MINCLEDFKVKKQFCSLVAHGPITSFSLGDGIFNDKVHKCGSG